MTTVKVTPAQFETLPAKLAASHEKAVMTPGANSGTIIEGSTKANFSFDPVASKLQLSVTHHSIFSLEGHAEKSLATNVEKVLA